MKITPAITSVLVSLLSLAEVRSLGIESLATNTQIDCIDNYIGQTFSSITNYQYKVVNMGNQGSLFTQNNIVVGTYRGYDNNG